MKICVVKVLRSIGVTKETVFKLFSEENLMFEDMRVKPFAMNDYVLRYSDIMLMRAEALIELGYLTLVSP